MRLTAEGGVLTQGERADTSLRVTVSRHRADIGIAVALMTVAAAVRFYNLLALDPFLDEIIWLFWSTRMFYSPDAASFCGTVYSCPQWSLGPIQLDLRSVSVYWLPIILDGRPPLYFWSINALTAVVDNAVVAGRLAAVIPSAGTTGLLYLLGLRLVSRPVGIVAGLLWAFSPFSVFFGRLGSDDALLTFWITASAVAAMELAVRGTWRSAVVCGLCIGAATLSKTLGLLALSFPFIAVLILRSPKEYLARVRNLFVCVCVFLVCLTPLLPWNERILTQISNFSSVADGQAGISAGSTSFFTDLLRRLSSIVDVRLLQVNIGAWWMYSSNYIGATILCTAALALLFGARKNGRSVLFCFAILFVLTFMVLNFTRFLYSRYILFTSFMLYILSAITIVQVSVILSRLLVRSYNAGVKVSRIQALMLSISVAIIVLLNGRYLFLMTTDPKQAPLPHFDHIQYIEQWYSVYGLSTVSEHISQAGATQPVTLIVPKPAIAWQVLLPHEALRMYLRGDHHVQFVEVDSLAEARSLCELQRWQSSASPVFLVVNGTHQGGILELRGRAAEHTRRIEAALARDVPAAREVLRIPRPTAANWLSVYRLDRGAAPVRQGNETHEGAGACQPIHETYDSGWSEPQTDPEAFVKYRVMKDGATVSVGPLPEGNYRVSLWVRSEASPRVLRVFVDGTDLGTVQVPAGASWNWLDTSLTMPLRAQSHALVRVTSEAAGGGQFGEDLLVRQIELIRDLSGT